MCQNVDTDYFLKDDILLPDGKKVQWKSAKELGYLSGYNGGNPYSSIELSGY